MMKEFLNKKVLIHFFVDGIDKYFTATISSITDTHITFTDKFGDPYTYRVADIVEIKLFDEEYKK